MYFYSFDYIGNLYETKYTISTGIQQCSTILESDTIQDIDWLKSLKNDTILTTNNPIIDHQIIFVKAKLMASKVVTGSLIITSLLLLLVIVSLSIYIYHYRKGNPKYYDINTHQCCGNGCGTLMLVDPCTAVGLYIVAYIATIGIGIPTWPGELKLMSDKAAQILNKGIPNSECTFTLFAQLGYYIYIVSGICLSIGVFYLTRVRDNQDKPKLPTTSLSSNHIMVTNNITLPTETTISQTNDHNNIKEIPINMAIYPSKKRPSFSLFYYPTARSGPIGRMVDWGSIHKR